MNRRFFCDGWDTKISRNGKVTLKGFLKDLEVVKP